MLAFFFLGIFDGLKKGADARVGLDFIGSSE